MRSNKDTILKKKRGKDPQYINNAGKWRQKRTNGSSRECSATEKEIINKKKILTVNKTTEDLLEP